DLVSFRRGRRPATKPNRPDLSRRLDTLAALVRSTRNQWSLGRCQLVARKLREILLQVEFGVILRRMLGFAILPSGQAKPVSVSPSLAGDELPFGPMISQFQNQTRS